MNCSRFNQITVAGSEARKDQLVLSSVKVMFSSQSVPLTLIGCVQKACCVSQRELLKSICGSAQINDSCWTQKEQSILMGGGGVWRIGVCVRRMRKSRKGCALFQDCGSPCGSGLIEPFVPWTTLAICSPMKI